MRANIDNLSHCVVIVIKNIATLWILFHANYLEIQVQYY